MKVYIICSTNLGEFKKRVDGTGFRGTGDSDNCQDSGFTPLVINFTDRFLQAIQIDFIIFIYINSNNILIADSQNASSLVQRIVAPLGDKHDTPFDSVGTVSSLQSFLFHTFKAIFGSKQRISGNP